jgi:hypothetical protein
MQCPQSYKYHYVDRIRSNVSSAALSFGSALDAAINVLLTNTGNPEEKFTEEFTYAFVNGARTHLPSSPNLVYSDADYDDELVSATSERKERYKELRNKKKTYGYSGLNEEEKIFYNEMNWQSMRAKGFLMLDAYRKKVMPRIEKIHAIQHKIELDNGDGDIVTGYIDLIATLKDHGVVVIDNKTSARDYEEQSVLTSPQLSLYINAVGAEYGTRKASYIVLKKNIRKNRTKECQSCGHNGDGSRAKTCDNVIAGKRCGGTWTEGISPEVDIQFLVDEIPERTETLVMENIDAVNQAIKAEHYTKNLSSCLNTYGGPCPYLNLCYKGSMKDLVKV